MLIGVASSGLNVASFTNGCDNFTFYTVEYGMITCCQSLPNPQLTSEQTAHFLRQVGTNVLLCDYISPQEEKDCHKYGIDVYSNRFGSALKAAQHFLNEVLLSFEEAYA